MRSRRAGADHVGGGLDAESGRRTGDIHVEGEAVYAERLLDLDGDGRIGALVVGRRADDGVDIGGGAAGLFERDCRRLQRHLGHQRQFVVGAFRQDRMHDLRIERAGLVEDVAALDARTP
jgi:hypothetical protein